MPTTTVTNEGQIILPPEIYNHLKLSAGSKIELAIDANGDVKIIPLTTPVEILSGILYQPTKEAATPEDMENSIMQGASITNTGKTNDWT